MNHIETMKKALDALESCVPDPEIDFGSAYGIAKKRQKEAIKSLRAAIAQPDEPVAWIASEVLRKIKDFDGTVYGRPGFDDAVPLYLHPAPYVPLTDESLLKLMELYPEEPNDWGSRIEFARAIERAVRGTT